MNDSKINKISFSGLIQDVGAAACKAMPSGHRHRYKMAITYHIEGGKEEQSFICSKTRKGLQERLIDHSDFAIQGKMFALYNDKGEMWGTRITF